jgi:hypothetical protein
VRLALAAVLFALAPALAQQPVEAEARPLEALQAEAFAAIEAGDYEQAERLLREQKGLNPNTFVPWYNLACVRALAGDAEGAVEFLHKAVERGFVDVHHLRRDRQLDSIRGHDGYRLLVERWPAVLDAHLEANLGQAQRVVEGGRGTYEVHRDERLRIAWLSAMDATSFEQARADIERLHDWGIATVFPELAEAAELDAWVVIVLPSPRDFLRWTIATFGPDAATGVAGIGGLYDHDLRRLVAQDVGPTLRHEFFHVLHWRSMTRLGQSHPIWIQEGLCSLVEEYEVEGERIRPVASWRTNIVKRLAGSGRLQPLRRLASMPREHFAGTAALANYAQARAFFLFLHEEGKLGAWYRAYTKAFEEDPTGLVAAEAVFGGTLEEVEREYRAWVRALPQVAEQQRPGEASLGVDVDPGSGDGPVIVAIPRERRSELREAGLRVGDVITAVDGRSTRDLNELVRVLGGCEAGDEVEIAYRRGRMHGTARVRLIGR